MRVAIFGAGGAGGYFGAHLARAGQDVAFIARGEHLRAIRDDGIHIESPDGSFVARSALVAADPSEVGHVDAVILGVKTWQLRNAIRALPPLIGPETFVVPLQNGVEAYDQVAGALGAAHAVGGLCATVSYLEGPGRIRNLGGPSFIKFGEWDGSESRRATALAAAFRGAGVSVEVSRDIQAEVWKKFLFVISWGGVGAVARAPIGVLREMTPTRGLLRQCIEEILDLARAKRIGLDDGIVDKSMALIDQLAPAATTSLQRDIVSGRRSELEAWNGAAVRLGSELDVPTPLHSFIYKSLAPLEARACGHVDFS